MTGALPSVVRAYLPGTITRTLQPCRRARLRTRYSRRFSVVAVTYVSLCVCWLQVAVVGCAITRRRGQSRHDPRDTSMDNPAAGRLVDCAGTVSKSATRYAVLSWPGGESPGAHSESHRLESPFPHVWMPCSLPAVSGLPMTRWCWRDIAQELHNF